ncbi:MAG: Rho termination factor N-terminal domain-containing protein, partial [Thermoguttaceae bacterium]|nr:Rho termination factor N-terminal domain-containing protein [Thermoguttaceae bacterium]
MADARESKPPVKQRRFAARTPRPGEGEPIDFDREEPLSLAEELVDRNGILDEETDERYEQIKQSGDTHIAELQRMSMAQLIEEARKDNLADYAGMKKQDLIFRILKERVK